MLHRLKLKHPIVLVHGLGARHSYGPIEYFYGLPKILRDSDNAFRIAELTPWHSIEFRAQQLKQQIEKHYPDAPKVNLLAHSMGGLDSRYLTSALNFGDRIASVTTIGTPHRGSHVGDLAGEILGDVTFNAANRFLSFLDSSSEGLRQIGTRYNAEVLGPRMPDVPGVGYFSVASAIPKNVMKYSLPVFWVPHRILKGREGDNDGFVSVQSATWGNHIGTYAGDHYGQIGQILGRSRGLNYLELYEDILTRLKREGF